MRVFLILLVLVAACEDVPPEKSASQEQVGWRVSADWQQTVQENITCTTTGTHLEWDFDLWGEPQEWVTKWDCNLIDDQYGWSLRCEQKSCFFAFDTGCFWFDHDIIVEAEPSGLRRGRMVHRYDAGYWPTPSGDVHVWCQSYWSASVQEIWL